MGSKSPKTNLEPEWTFVGGKGTAEKTTSNKKRDLNGFRDPCFPLHLVKEKMCHLDVFGMNLDWWPHFVSPYAPPWPGSPPPTCCVPWVWPSNPQRKPTWNPTSLALGGTNSSKFLSNCHVCLSLAHCWSFHLVVCSSFPSCFSLVIIVFLLLICHLLLFFSICWYLLSFHVVCFSLFAVRFSACCGLFWKVVRRTRNPTHIEK